ncbi:MAG: GNAT family N-acetyltransferase, partial [Pseudomonas sp.]|uniref:GNAT family N-acetyltransferase n=1 Tax=Pseudomonas sp. TaxID=306 RepID=UPI003C755BD3
MDAVTQTLEDFAINPLAELPEQAHALEALALREGFRFITRLITEWENQSNRFDQPGECLLGVFHHGQLIAIGGVSVDPYAGPGIARLRRVYVAPEQRGRQVGKALVHQLLEHAAGHFQQARLSTDTPQAAAFYRRCGFDEVADDT